MTRLPALYLKRNEDRRLRQGHLWFYANEIDNKRSPLKDLSPGAQVHLLSHRGALLGSAYVNPHTLLCGRLICRQGRPLDRTLLAQRLLHALTIRNHLFESSYYRLVYGESDLLPGLIVDRFGDHLSVQCNTAGMELLREDLFGCLVELLAPKSILLRNDAGVRSLEGLSQEITTAYGQVPDELEIQENGIRFLAASQTGQKTGWFYDQRGNRAMLRAYVKGRRLLDVFSYVGGFGVTGGFFGAREIWCVDSSRPALELAERNSIRNGLGDRFTGLQGDAFEVLRGLYEDGERFEVIVVDPPAFIKRKKDREAGLKAYRRINELAMKLLTRGGILFSASCSMHLQRDDLVEVLRGAAIAQHKHLRILEEGSQGPDHPIHPAIPETKYLKGLLAHVDES
jgi:23S rRNA (cytosine1962-C5)-methyltransferase